MEETANHGPEARIDAAGKNEASGCHPQFCDNRFSPGNNYHYCLVCIHLR